MIPSPFASAYVYGRAKKPLIDAPTESRVVPVPIVGSGLPAASLPMSLILFELCDAASVTSQPSARRSSSVALTESSRPLFDTEPRFFTTERVEAPDEAAIGCDTRASLVDFV